MSERHDAAVIRAPTTTPIRPKIAAVTDAFVARDSILSRAGSERAQSAVPTGFPTREVLIGVTFLRDVRAQVVGSAAVEHAEFEGRTWFDREDAV
jgi:hypothetical protein